MNLISYLKSYKKDEYNEESKYSNLVSFFEMFAFEYKNGIKQSEKLLPNFGIDRIKSNIEELLSLDDDDLICSINIIEDIVWDKLQSFDGVPEQIIKIKDSYKLSYDSRSANVFREDIKNLVWQRLYLEKIYYDLFRDDPDFRPELIDDIELIKSIKT